jgi:glucosylceramidase
VVQDIIPEPIAGDGTISITPSVTFQTIDGFGSSARNFDDPHVNGLSPTASSGGIITTAAQRDDIYDLLYDPVRGIGLNRVRFTLTNPGWQLSDGGPIVTDGPYPGPQATKTLAYLDNGLRRNPEFKYAFQSGEFDSWITGDTPPARIAGYIKSGLDYAKSKGYEPDWQGVGNEPSNGPPYFTGAQLREIIKALGSLLDADGRYTTKISAPDDINDAKGAPKAATILADPMARRYIKAISTHLYGDTPIGQLALSKSYGIPLWMTEYDASGDTDGVEWASNIVHEMIVTFNCSAVDMLLGFLGGGASGKPDEYTYITLKSSGTTYLGYKVNPWYYATGQWSKYVKRGAVRIAATSTSPEVKVSAFVKNSKSTLVLVHTANSAARRMAIPAGTFRVIQTQIRGTDRLADKGLVTGTVTLLPRSITTLIEQ